ncbi:ABC transporter ATP-binding protein [Shimia sp.]|uniref:ABC transporter ATP-binding protein n=1 Tax=Shimia sp. TaxID=1954381 RepID=UPI003297FD05
MLDSFEQGYKAGWEDAVRAKSDERANISADFARNIQNLSFTYHEARGAMIAELSPVIEKAVMTVLPELSRQSIGAQVSEELNTILEENSDIPVLITTSPENYEVVCELLPSDVNLPIDVVRDTNLTEGQVRLQFGQKERQIDLDEVVSVVSSAFAGFTHETQKEIMNG